MHLHHDPDTTTEATPTGSPSARAHAGEELDHARKADAAWRAAHKARFAVPLAWLQRWTRLIEFWLGALAMVSFVLGFVLLGNSGSPSAEDPTWGIHVDPYLDAGAYCFLAFLALAAAAFSVGGLSRWGQRLIRTRASAQAVELED